MDITAARNQPRQETNSLHLPRGYTWTLPPFLPPFLPDESNSRPNQPWLPKTSYATFQRQYLDLLGNWHLSQEMREYSHMLLPMAHMLAPSDALPYLLSVTHLRYLTAGNFSDLTLQFGERSWKIHKAIACCHSKWFHTILTIGFKVSICIL